MSGPNFIELSSPYRPGPYAIDGRFHSRPRSNSIGSHHRKSASANYKPILTRQDEYDNAGLHTQDDQNVSSINLGRGRIDKYGIDLVTEIVVCTFAVLVSVPFIWLAVAMAKMHHEEVTESRTDFVKQATSTVSTLFTILFAAVLGSTLRHFATWRLQRGVSLGLLEQVMQSRTVFSAVTTQISFRAFNLTALVLLCTWTFSPLGSQASLRLIHTGTTYTTETGSVSYVDTITNQVFDSVSGVDSLLTALKPMYISSVLGPATMKNGTTDLWGNVRIPWLTYDASKDNNGWTTLSRDHLTEGAYSSLVGIPVASLTDRNSSFALETTYMNLDCDKPEIESLIDIGFNVTSSNGTFLGPNTTSPDDNAIYPSWQVAMNEFVDDRVYYYGYPELLVNASDANLPQATFLFQTRGPWVSRCKINQVYVESNVTCISVTDSSLPVCSVGGQRQSPNRHAPSTVTTLSFPSTFRYLMHEWIMATDPTRSSGYSTLTEYYLQNTSAAFILSGNNREYADFSNVTAEAFSQRLGQLLNTWVLAGQVSANTMQFTLNTRNSTALYTEGRLVYLCSWRWLGVYVASIAVMFITALFSIWCVAQTTIPDVLGYSSSLTRDSKFFNFVKGGSTLSGIARARKLRELEVKLGEVIEESDDGRFRNEFVNDLDPRMSDDRRRYLAIASPEYLRTPERGTLYI
ncbi:hypothetical protein A1O1_01823 [Capronia coronata CBS 617.96]|uniref:Uncharacterized protein n=1 Tax=Capronia coronata CBS 617.96 TaxID=1182541 RepID=W9YVZ1_9EURO|nr:uncharacterized protein A1O1_01823 [Capronia coronata CBS 617.96]EXJ93431.1 hypothetical protein A1O1_01823 [Capronia coronata CBS 617.96]